MENKDIPQRLTLSIFQMTLFLQIIYINQLTKKKGNTIKWYEDNSTYYVTITYEDNLSKLYYKNINGTLYTLDIRCI